MIRHQAPPQRGSSPVPAFQYDSYTDARAHLKEVLDAAENGQLVTVRRDASKSAVIDAERLRHFLATCPPSSAQVVHEDGGWSAFVPGLPVAGDGATFEEAIDAERLRHALPSCAPSSAKVVHEDGGWSVFVPGLPVAGDGATFEEAIAD